MAEITAAWRAHATEFTRRNGGKPWHYALIPHDAGAENKTLVLLPKNWTV